MWWDCLPPDYEMPDPNDPDYQLGVLLGTIVALLLGLPIFWWTLG